MAGIAPVSKRLVVSHLLSDTHCEELLNVPDDMQSYNLQEFLRGKSNTFARLLRWPGAVDVERLAARVAPLSRYEPETGCEWQMIEIEEATFNEQETEGVEGQRDGTQDPHLVVDEPAVTR
jgi:hypothetical protein